MSIVNSTPLLLGDDGYQISRSVRLRSGAPAYLTRTPAVAGSQTTWTWSAWFKRGNLSTVQGLFAAQAAIAANPLCRINFGAADLLSLIETNSGGTTLYSLTPSMVFRDISAWYHLVVVFDSTNATSTERVRMYVNGSRVTSFSVATYPALNQVSAINSVMAHQIGRLASNDTTNLFDGYLTEINFIGNQALTAAEFGEFNSITGVWQPKKYTGTYGTNGFYLNFSNNSAATATTIGKDYSGNGNNWTPNGISVTAGAAYDSMLDVPTMWADGGNGRGNYAMLNPLDKNVASITLVNTNLAASITATNVGVRGSIGVNTGKWYWEVTYTTLGGTSIFGIADSAWPLTYVGSTAMSYGYGSNANKFSNAVSTAYGATFTTGDVIGIAFDASAGTIEFYKNNVSQGVAYTGIPSGVYFPAISGQTNAVLTANFGQRPFAYTPPSGFKAINTQNLPALTVIKGNQHFNASLWTGNGSTKTIVNDAGFQPGLVWIKGRSGATDSALYDLIRGATNDLVTNSSAAATTQPTGLTSFNSGGFSIGALAKVNTNLATYAGWQWKTNGTPVTNTAGTITSQVSANVSAGISAISFTGNATAGATVGHGLGVAPKMIIWRSKTAGFNWVVGHQNLTVSNPWSHWLKLELTDGIALHAGPWNNTAPTANVFTLGSYNPTSVCLAYCFSEVEGFSKFGTYTGNGLVDGPFVFCGFKPRFILLKNCSVANNWIMLDTARDPYNQMLNTLNPNLASAESPFGSGGVDILSNGFKLRTTSAAANTNGNVIIYAAFAENPFKNALAR